MKAVAYARFSSDNQRDESIDAQVRAIKYYADQAGYEIIKIYADKAKSGRTTDRPQFMQMINDSDKGDFKVVIVHKLDRFSRDSTDTLMFERKLKTNGVELVSVNEKLDRSPEGALMKMVITGMNEFYSKNLAREVMKGLKENAYNCIFTGGIPPLGYDIDGDKKYIINMKESEAVKIIFDMYSKGYGYGDIIETLNRGAYRTKAGKLLGKNSLHEILKNEKYSGVYIYNKLASKDIQGKMNRRKFKSDSEIIKIEGGIPAIIDKKLFEEVQKRMSENKRMNASHKAKTDYLLSGKLICGNCGNIMTGERRIGERGTYYYYVCNYKKRTGQCDKRSIRADIIEREVLENINKKIFCSRNIDEICKRIYEGYNNNDADALISEYNSEVKSIDTKINNLYKAIEQGLTVTETMKRINSLSQEKNVLQVKILELESIPANNKTIEEIKATFSQMADIKKLPPKEQKAVIQRFIYKIFVYDEEGSKKIKVRVVINPNNINVSELLDTSGRGRRI